jgi:phospholipase/carboxylesterase
VDPRHASEDDDLDSLRGDPRYAAVMNHLRQAAAYWRVNAKPVTLVYTPDGFDKSKPTPVLVCLHGRGSRPQDFFGETSKKLAASIGLPVVCVSGTRPTGPRSFVWAVDPAADTKRLDDALKAAADKLTPADGKVILIGFSEGAQVAAEVAARNPVRYAGAIVMSPGAEFMLDRATSNPKLRDRRFVVTIGVAEHPGNVTLSRQDWDWLKKAGAQVVYRSFPGVGHSLPPGFVDLLPQWVEFILEGDTAAPPKGKKKSPPAGSP